MNETSAADGSYYTESVLVNPDTNRVYVGTAILNGETLEEITPSLTNTVKAIDPTNNFLYTVVKSFSQRFATARCRYGDSPRNPAAACQLPAHP